MKELRHANRLDMRHGRLILLKRVGLTFLLSYCLWYGVRERSSVAVQNGERGRRPKKLAIADNAGTRRVSQSDLRVGLFGMKAMQEFPDVFVF